MSGREVLALALLLPGVLIGFCAALALVPLRSAFDRLHLGGTVATVGIGLTVAAILVRVGISAVGAKAVLTGALIFLLSPAVTHMTARARWSRGRREGGEHRANNGRTPDRGDPDHDHGGSEGDIP